MLANVTVDSGNTKKTKNEKRKTKKKKEIEWESEG